MVENINQKQHRTVCGVFPSLPLPQTLGPAPFFFLSLEWSMETRGMQTTKQSTRHAMQSKARAQHPPFMVKIIHWARSKDGSIPDMEKGSQRKAEP